MANNLVAYFKLDQPALCLNRELLMRGLNNKSVRAYYEYMVDVAVIYGAEQPRAERELLDSLQFEIALANVNCNYLFFHLILC